MSAGAAFVFSDDLEVLHYSSAFLRSLRSSCSRRHLVDSDVVERVGLLGLRRHGKRGGRQRQCCDHLGQLRSRPLCLPLLGNVSTTASLQPESTTESCQQSIPVITSNRHRDHRVRSSLTDRPNARSSFLKHVVVDKCSHSCASSANSPKIYILNVCSIAKPHAFQQILTDVILTDVIILTETHLNSKHSSKLFDISDYLLFRKDRLKRKGGGICVCVKQSLTVNLSY